MDTFTSFERRTVTNRSEDDARSEAHGTRRTVTVGLVVLLVCTVAIGALAAPALAQDDHSDGPPPLPAAYHGDLEINGEPADAGVVIEAEIDGEVRGSSTVGESGTYGGPDAEDPKLEVDGTDSDAGENVTFYVEGDDFDRTAVDDAETVTWEPESVERVDLSAAVDIDDGGSGGDGDGGSNEGDNEPGDGSEGADSPPSAVIDIMPGTSVDDGETVTLSAADSSDDGEIIGYEWTLDGDAVGTDESVSISPEVGIYEVALTVTDNASQTDTATETLTVDDADEHTATITVEDAEGDPIEEATVTIGEHNTETNADGIGTIALEAGQYTVTIEAPGFESTSETLTVADGDVTLTASLESTAESDSVPLLVMWPGVAALILVGSACYRLRAHYSG